MMSKILPMIIFSHFDINTIQKKADSTKISKILGQLEEELLHHLKFTGFYDAAVGVCKLININTTIESIQVGNGMIGYIFIFKNLFSHEAEYQQ